MAPIAQSPKPNPKFGWEEMSEDIRRVVLMSIYGETDTGRTTLALTAPWPVALLHGKEKIDGIVQNARAAKRKAKQNDTIRLHKFGHIYRGDEAGVKRAARADFEELTELFVDAMSWARTVIIDTHTLGYEILRLAHFGKTAQVKSHWYGPVYAEWRNFAMLARDQERANVIMIGQAGEKYFNDKPMGRLEQKGMKEMGYLSDVVVRTECDKDGDYTATIEKPWYNSSARGIVLMNKQATFPMVMDSITGVDDERWSE